LNGGGRRRLAEKEEKAQRNEVKWAMGYEMNGHWGDEVIL
jgi:hypothetical protein